MKESTFDHVDFVYSKGPPMEMLSRYLGKWVLETVMKVEEGDTDFEDIDM